MMRDRFLVSMTSLAIAAAAIGAAVLPPIAGTSAQPQQNSVALKTTRGEPDLQGI